MYTTARIAVLGERVANVGKRGIALRTFGYRFNDVATSAALGEEVERNIDRRSAVELQLHALDRDVDEPGAAQRRRDDIGIRLRERPRPDRCGQWTGVREERSAGNDEPLVGHEGLPSSDAQPPVRLQRGGDVPERGRRIRERHRAEPADDEIGGTSFERVGLDIRMDEPRRAGTREPGTLAGHRQHRGSDVDPDRKTGLADLLGDEERRGTAAATDVDDDLSRRGCCGGEQDVGDRREERIVLVGGGRPLATLLAVPSIGCRGRWGGWWCAHRRIVQPEVRFKSMGAKLTIIELGGRTGLASSALRFYERRGLLRSSGRSGGMRVYDESAVEQIALVDLLKIVGFTLTEIAEVVDVRGRVSDDWRDKARIKVGELEARIAELRRARAILQHTINCPHPTLNECPVFRAGVADHAAKLGTR